MKPGSKVTIPHAPSAGKTGRRYGAVVSVIRAIPLGRYFTSVQIEHLMPRRPAAALLRDLCRRGELERVMESRMRHFPRGRSIYVRAGGHFMYVRAGGPISNQPSILDPS